MTADDTAALETLRARLARLDDDDVSAHPGVLDDVHRRLVAVLDELGRAGPGQPGA